MVSCLAVPQCGQVSTDSYSTVLMGERYFCTVEG